MWKFLKRHFIPHFENEYRPHVLRGRSIFFLSLVVLFLFGLQLLYTSVIVGSNFFAAILPGVIADLTNGDRAQDNAHPLAVNSLLTQAALKKAQDMAVKSYFAHTSPEGKTPWYWFGVVGYGFSYAGENLAVNFTDSQDVETAWLNSPGHRANILNKNFTEIGIATAQGIYQGVQTTFVVEMFGRPAQALALPRARAVISIPPPPSAKPKQARALKPTLEPAPSPLTPAPVATKGAETAPANLEVVSSDNMFIAVRNTDVTLAAGPHPPSLERVSTSRVGSWVRKLATSPRFVLDFLYGLLAVIVSIPLLLAIVVEVEKQHAHHIVYAVFFLFLVSTAMYASHVWLLSRVLIV